MRRGFLFFFLMVSVAVAAPRKVHVIALGAARTVPYSREGDPAGARTGGPARACRTARASSCSCRASLDDARRSSAASR